MMSLMVCSGCSEATTKEEVMTVFPLSVDRVDAFYFDCLAQGVLSGSKMCFGSCPIMISKVGSAEDHCCALKHRVC